MSQAGATLKCLDAGVVPYGTAYRWQRAMHSRRVAGEVDDVLLLLEHPHVYTLGRRFRARHLLADPAQLVRLGAEVHEADRGGSVTYHGPGQLVAYPIVDLRPADGGLPDPIGYLRILERVIVDALGVLGIRAGTRAGLTGVWAGQEKLASIGVNVSRGVAKHGLALNVSTDLSYFAPIVPCGIEGCRMTSIERRLGCSIDMEIVKRLVAEGLAQRLGRCIESVSIKSLDLPAAEPPPAGRLGERAAVGA